MTKVKKVGAQVKVKGPPMEPTEGFANHPPDGQIMTIAALGNHSAFCKWRESGQTMASCFLLENLELVEEAT